MLYPDTFGAATKCFKPSPAMIGLNGRLLAAGGFLCLVAGVRHWQRPAPGLRRTVVVLGWGLTGFTIWLGSLVAGATAALCSERSSRSAN